MVGAVQIKNLASEIVQPLHPTGLKVPAAIRQYMKWVWTAVVHILVIDKLLNNKGKVYAELDSAMGSRGSCPWILTNVGSLRGKDKLKMFFKMKLQGLQYHNVPLGVHQSKKLWKMIAVDAWDGSWFSCNYQRMTKMLPTLKEG